MDALDTHTTYENCLGTVVSWKGGAGYIDWFVSIFALHVIRSYSSHVSFDYWTRIVVEIVLSKCYFNMLERSVVFPLSFCVYTPNHPPPFHKFLSFIHFTLDNNSFFSQLRWRRATVTLCQFPFCYVFLIVKEGHFSDVCAF